MQQYSSDKTLFCIDFPDDALQCHDAIGDLKSGVGIYIDKLDVSIECNYTDIYPAADLLLFVPGFSIAQEQVDADEAVHITPGLFFLHINFNRSVH